MADGEYVEKKSGEGIFLLRFFCCGNLSTFESCNGNAFKVFVPKTVTSSCHLDQSYIYEICATSIMHITILCLSLSSVHSMLIQYSALTSLIYTKL